MSALIEIKDRRVIPNFRDFFRTAAIGELNQGAHLPDRNFETSYVIKYIADWLQNRTIGHAADLLNAAFIADLNNTEIRDAANFIIANKNFASSDLLMLAKYFLRTEQDFDKSTLLEHETFDELKMFLNVNNLYDKIRFYKEKILFQPRNSIAHVELARLYSFLGQKDKAISAMIIACNLAPNNRYVLRSATRLLIHFRELDLAYHYLKRSEYVSNDPWLMSAEVSLAQIRNKHSKNIKKGLELVSRKNVNPWDITELSSALATIEFYNGDNKASKKLFSLSLQAPNDNTLAQAEWARSKDLSISIAPTLYKITNPFEALALDSFDKSRWAEGLRYCKLWLSDLPYSRRPITMGTYIAITLLNKHDVAEELCKIGLQINPNNPDLINNYCYLLGLNNRADEGIEHMNKILPYLNSLQDEQKIILQATAGLLYYRKGWIDLGRQAYQNALNNCKKINDDYLYQIGLLNYLREEIIADGIELIKVKEEAVQIFKKTSEYPDVEFLKKQIFETYKVA